MWSRVFAVHRTMLYTVRKKLAGKPVLILLPAIGAMPLILPRVRTPVTLQPNAFCPAFGLAPQAAE